ncbi:Hpt domain-containing protein [Chitinolyticbacter meiyuanensis]|uniref:Hpt domain-containing protein n=1 Tax=Chitinolyticbacter meiyuanensis TaxID=682798 RepID=UPI001651EA6E|nr:Hpt domain-containing protein [Chitinolyticbacter meiyuanensis]
MADRDESVIERIEAELASVEAMMAQLRSQVGMDLRAELIAAFVPLLQDTLSRLPPALAGGDADSVIRLSHKLKGAALQLGAERLASGCQQIEAAGRQGQLQLAEATFAGVRDLSHGLLLGFSAH